MDWTSGYLADIDYTHGYYRELAPSLIDFALLLSGHEPPDRTGMRYLELGYGQGVSANIHAAAAPGEFWGADFNPTHAANAQSLARSAGSHAHFSDDSFADFLNRQDTPSFDYIALHGVWSWVSDDNRRAIVEIVRRQLNVGGAVYISYNTLPGWAVSMPLRHLMSLYYASAGSQTQGIVGRIDASLAFGSRLAEAGARYFAASPGAKERLDFIAGQNRNYVAHEYFNRHWAPMHFSEAHEWLSGAKLGYACPADALDQMDVINLTSAQQEVMKELQHQVLSETVRDFFLNQAFRRDIYTRGARRLSGLQRVERFKALAVVMTSAVEDISFEVEGGLGKVRLKPQIYRPIIEALADGAEPKRVGDLPRRPELAEFSQASLMEALAVLVGAGWAAPAQSEADTEAARPRCRALNAQLIERARAAGFSGVLASPVTGSGVPVGRLEQLFLGARSRGKAAPADWAAEAWSILARQNEAIIKDGAVLPTAEANLAELSAQASAFADKRLPLLQRLLVVD
ncbi:MAG TPA: class I SAM-dependent methyltransferase [Caulobacteraceae bacterium]|nr:class I SAM-dependent methyltransferase [Caulobacteraceae bacterium]